MSQHTSCFHSSLSSGARPEQESCQKSRYSELLCCAHSRTRQNRMGAVETHFRNDPTPKRGSLAARETSEKSAALRSLTQIIFAIRRKRWLRLDGRRSIQPFRGRKLPKPHSIGAHTAVNRRAMVGRDLTTPAAPHSGWQVLLRRRNDNDRIRLGMPTDAGCR
jgi:hypothetical protein